MSKIQVRCAYDKLVPIKDLKPHPKNPNKHSQGQIERLAKVIEYQGIRRPIRISKRSGYITSGHGLLSALRKLKMVEAPVNFQDYASDEQEFADLVADNSLQSWSELDLASINLEVPSLGPDFDIDLLGIKDFEIEPADKYDAQSGILVKKFGVPPFSVFDTRQEYWQKRKNYWLDKGIESYSGRDKVGKLSASTQRIKGASESLKKLSVDAGVSIFDPFLAEICYSWFAPKDAVIIDPFSGGSVRGLIATWLGKQYHGIDLSPFQIEANKLEAKKFNIKPNWYQGDSVEINQILDNQILGDFIFSCPPYGHLEIYTDHPKDLSNMGTKDFLNTYKQIIQSTCLRLKNNRFACFVVGDYRDKNGFYCNFVSETIDGFIKSGLHLYNEIILINESGTAALRANRQFNAAKKVVKTHQNVLIFCKGDPKIASNDCGPVEFDISTILEQEELNSDLGIIA